MGYILPYASLSTYQAKSLYAFVAMHSVNGNGELCAAANLSGRKNSRTD
jgi:hypothetical protein